TDGRNPADFRSRPGQGLRLPRRLRSRHRLRGSRRPALLGLRRPGEEGGRGPRSRRGRPGADVLVQGETMTDSAEAGVPGLTNPRGLGLERFPIRAREQAMTLAAWRLSAAAEEGEGTITLVELPSGEIMRRGDGIFMGWTQERLGRAY